ncbi:hypothetical protein IZY60_09795 [Lutibacter sp. B2]|nr:hypothetical protein [Lutibacter sp. B2]
MYSGKFKLLVISVCVSISALFFCVFKLLCGNDHLMLPIILLIINTIYVFSNTYNEYKICKLDQLNGIEEKILKLYFVESNLNYLGFRKRNTTNKEVIAVFEYAEVEDKKDLDHINTIGLTGDFSKIKLNIGKLYKVSYYKNSRLAVSIEEFKEM